MKLPLGVAEAIDFSADGKVFTMQAETPKRPTDLFLVDAASGNVRPLREDVRAGLSDTPDSDVMLDKVNAFDGLTIPINVYLPKDRAGKKRPVMVYIHGGPVASAKVWWSVGDRFFVGEDYAFVAPHIRGSSGFGRADQMADDREKRADAIRDLETVNPWVRAQPRADPDRIFDYRGSATMLALTRQPTLWRGGVALVGFANLVSFLQSTSKELQAAFVPEFGDVDKDRALLEEFSPIHGFYVVQIPVRLAKRPRN